MAEIRTTVNVDLPGEWAENEARRIHDRIRDVLGDLGHEAVTFGHQLIEGKLTRLQVRGVRTVEEPSAPEAPTPEEDAATPEGEAAGVSPQPSTSADL